MTHAGAFKELKLSVSSETGVGLLQLSRPAKSNAVTLSMLEELQAALELCERDTALRALVLHAEGSNFCSGLDFQALGSIVNLQADPSACPGETRDTLRRSILHMQVRLCPGALRAPKQARLLPRSRLQGCCVINRISGGLCRWRRLRAHQHMLVACMHTQTAVCWRPELELPV